MKLELSKHWYNKMIKELKNNLEGSITAGCSIKYLLISIKAGSKNES